MESNGKGEREGRVNGRIEKRGRRGLKSAARRDPNKTSERQRSRRETDGSMGKGEEKGKGEGGLASGLWVAEYRDHPREKENGKKENEKKVGSAIKKPERCRNDGSTKSLGEQIRLRETLGGRKLSRGGKGGRRGTSRAEIRLEYFLSSRLSSAGSCSNTASGTTGGTVLCSFSLLSSSDRAGQDAKLAQELVWPWSATWLRLGSTYKPCRTRGLHSALGLASCRLQYSRSRRKPAKQRSSILSSLFFLGLLSVFSLPLLTLLLLLSSFVPPSSLLLFSSFFSPPPPPPLDLRRLRFCNDLTHA